MLTRSVFLLSRAAHGAFLDKDRDGRRSFQRKDLHMFVRLTGS